jgi:type VI secretion system secreted protein Hcp
MADYFLQITGVEGESLDSKHKSWIDVLSWSWGETNAGAGKVDFGDLAFTMRVSKASPKLFLACATGQHFKQATLVGRKAGKGQQEFLTWTFSDVLVSGFHTGDAVGSDAPLDNVSLNVAKAQISYQAQKADGSLDTPITSGFDTKTNKKS